ncbi:MAG: glycosyltransferase family 2 protein [Planctomycetota bacterium]|jgi:glycosyltransferase involved in cell wall biosynthesis
MKVSIIIPCFNEKDTIEALINTVAQTEIEDKEIILVDDFSTDGTREILKGPLSAKTQKIVYHERNLGKGAALRTGFKNATGDVVVIQDADLEYDPSEYPNLLDPILSGKADIVYGSRLMSGQPRRVLFFWHMVGNRFLTLLSNMTTNLNLSDMETGYKVFKRDVLAKITLKENRFGFEPEVTAKLARLKFPIYEVGISYYGRTYAEGKKINWKDGFRAIYVILKYRIFK